MKKTISIISATIFSMTLAASADDAKCDASDKKCAKSCAEKMEKNFALHDKDKDGKLSMVEFKALISACKADGCSDDKKAVNTAAKPAATVPTNTPAPVKKATAPAWRSKTKWKS